MKSFSHIDTCIASRLDQFEVRDLIRVEAPILANINFSITNIGLYLTIAALITLTVYILAVYYNKVISLPLQSLSYSSLIKLLSIIWHSLSWSNLMKVLNNTLHSLSWFNIMKMLSKILQNIRNNKPLYFAIFLIISFTKIMPSWFAAELGLQAYNYYSILPGLGYGLVCLIKDIYFHFKPFSGKKFTIDIGIGILISKLVVPLGLALFVIGINYFPSYCPDFFKHIYYIIRNKWDKEVYKLLLFKLDSDVMDTGSRPATPIDTSGDTNYYTAGNEASIAAQNDPTNLDGTENNYGWFGGTIKGYADWVSIEVTKWPTSFTKMLTRDCPYWAELRTLYDIQYGRGVFGMERNVPYITHVPIKGNRFHESGIMVHLLTDNRHYSELKSIEWKEKKKLIRELLIDKGDAFEEARQNFLTDPVEARDVRDVAKSAHEYLGVLHHYQLYFLTRNSASARRIAH